MNAIECELIITGISTRKDRSLGLRVITATELSEEEKLSFLQLEDHRLHCVLSPFEEAEAPTEHINKELTKKTQSQRLRDSLYVLFSQNNEGLSWEEFYKKKTDQMIDWVKSKIDS